MTEPLAVVLIGCGLAGALVWVFWVFRALSRATSLRGADQPTPKQGLVLAVAVIGGFSTWFLLVMTGVGALTGVPPAATGAIWLLLTGIVLVVNALGTQVLFWNLRRRNRRLAGTQGGAHGFKSGSTDA